METGPFWPCFPVQNPDIEPLGVGSGAQRQGEPELHVMFCPIGTPEHLSDDLPGIRCLQVYPSDKHMGSMLVSMEERWREMEEALGPGMVFHGTGVA